MLYRLSPLSLVIAIALVAMLAPRTPSHAAEREMIAPSYRLLQVQELRVQDVIAPKEETFSMEQPGLTLKFDLTLPGNRRLLEITNPQRDAVKAGDSTGHDLTAVEKNFMDELEYVKLIHFYGEDPKSFTFHLALPARRAASFDLNVQLEVVTFNATEDISLQISEEWTQLDATMFGKKKVQARVKRKGKEISLEIQPGTVKTALEEVQIFAGSTELEQGWSMWNPMSISYNFSGDAKGALTARLKVRTGLSKEILSIALDDQPLP